MKTATALAAPPERIRVLSVPAGHPYVRHLSAEQGDDAVARLVDPVREGAAPGQWWPPVAFDPSWLRAHADEYDLLHLHFGLESFSLAELDDVVAALRDLGKPLVYTVHDLENPQLVDQSHHLAQIERLVTAADVLVTLTPGAADEIESRWGRRPLTVPHPNVFPLDGEIPVGAPSVPVVLGMHLRDIRPNIDAVVAVETLLAALVRLRVRGIDAVARVFVNDRVRDSRSRDRVVALVAGHPGATLLEGPRLSDDELADSLADLDVAVLPYGHGTHSGWVELCFDLGVSVAGPPVGHLRDQHPESFAEFARDDAAALADAVERLLADGATRPGSASRRALVARRREDRGRQRIDIQLAHRAAYESAGASA
ncbi:glycosyl transferase family 4 [Frondihabitans sp. PhB188]|uniref:glycosyltransferase n=1 Tax=Frondihabitans sp. PhB188 TaxID=2485200 RepID=UPI000F4A6E99|nr:glycosyltransferase [Frondihabitans sp. PhB188]ROQ38782.1 glycosyl transferase family 4 [Frondihabitans sp. PhB188]